MSSRRPAFTVLLTAVCILFLDGAASIAVGENASWRDDFERGFLDPKVWSITRSGDFREWKADVVARGAEGNRDFRLRLRADTIMTDDKTVKSLGVRGVRPVSLEDGLEIALDLDWNDQSNGSYLTAAVYLCPFVTAKNPQEEPDWIRLEYHGVPPGKNGRAAVSAKKDGRIRWLFTEGWPEINREGRKIGLLKIRFQVKDKHLIIQENGKEYFRVDLKKIGLAKGYIYLQMTSHSNYPAREIFFDNLAVLLP